jgi:nitrogen fixation/metabolism regulation signal transduction histidine kinase
VGPVTFLERLVAFLSRLKQRTIARVLPGKTERNLALVSLLTTMVPLVAALWLGTSMFRQASAIWFDPQVGEQLDRGVEVYKDYVKAIKDDLKHQTVAIAADPALREAARKGNIETLEAQIDGVFPQFPELVSLTIEDAKGNALARRDRGRPVDASRERSLEVRRPLGEEDDAPVVVTTFAVPRQRLDELETTGNVVSGYHQKEQARNELYQGYVYAFAALLSIAFVITIILGIILARGITRRINRLGAAMHLVASGDLSARVPVTGNDELTDLARGFNRMLGEMNQSRARIEFLQRIGAWQDMAQRLAHEIKNPLTPIQLAVQEAHKKYQGEDVRYRALLDTTLEIVEEEVGTLRRLVGSFSNFARLPHAELAPSSLRDFLRDCEIQLGHLENPSFGETAPDGEPILSARSLSGATNVEIRWELPKEPILVAIDRQMLRRVIVNLVRNSVQAIRDARMRKSAPDVTAAEDGGVLGHVVVSATAEGDGARIEVEDDGPGIAESMRGRIFDPYFTTKADGTGLGLAIVKKIVVEHGGEIEASKSNRLGGARFVLHLPSTRILEIAAAAKEAREHAKQQGVETTGAP